MTLTFNYIRYGQDGQVTNVGLESPNNHTSFINKGNMAFIGTESKWCVYNDLLILADALRGAGHVVIGYDLLVEDERVAAHFFDEYKKAKDVP